MDTSSIRRVIEGVLQPARGSYHKPTSAEWASLEAELGTAFPPDFKRLLEVLSDFEFPGDIYNVSSAQPSNGNDLIADVYAFERGQGALPEWMVPFYGIGNGDYFCLDRRTGAQSAVFFWDHGAASEAAYSPSVEAWIASLPDFLADE